MKQKIFIDTDMGNDDIMAIMLLLNEPSIRIVGISTVYGVATKNNGLRNINRILNYIEKTILVKNGYQQALQEKQAQFPIRDSKRANKLTLLSNLLIPQRNVFEQPNCIEDFIFEKTADNQTIILALGPLTNLAKTIEKYGKSFTKNIKRIIIMGGGIKKGNVPPLYLAEYNIWLDPEAADIVFNSKIPITMVGIDATSYVKITQIFKQKVNILNPKNKELKILKEIIVNNNNDFNAYYDPLAAYILLNKRCITKAVFSGISVSLDGITRGQTILNRENSHVEIVLHVNANAFFRKLLLVLKGGE